MSDRRWRWAVLVWLAVLTLGPAARLAGRHVRRTDGYTQVRLGRVWATYEHSGTGRIRIIVWARHRRLTPIRWWHREERA